MIDTMSEIYLYEDLVQLSGPTPSTISKKAEIKSAMQARVLAALSSIKT